MKKIKILYGLEAAGGGALKHLVYLVTRLNKEIFDITVILSNSRQEIINDQINEMQNAGAKVIILSINKNINVIKDFYSIYKVISIIKKNKFDIIHAHSSKAGGIFRIAAWFCSVPVILYTPHCFYFQGKTGFKKTVYFQIECLLAKVTSFIIISESERKEITRTKLANATKIININNAIDFNEYKQNTEISKLKATLGIKENAFIIGTIGRLAPQKDMETFIYAANKVLNKHPETVFLIVGDGELQKEIQELIYKLHLEKKVILTGYIKEIHKVYAIIDVLVNTSLWEGLPYVFLEAMNYQKPIIATNTGNETIIVHDETGFITPIKDYNLISDKICILIENKQIALQMGKNGLERLTQKYSFEHFIKEHEKFYLNAFSEK